MKKFILSITSLCMAGSMNMLAMEQSLTADTAESSKPLVESIAQEKPTLTAPPKNNVSTLVASPVKEVVISPNVQALLRGDNALIKELLLLSLQNAFTQHEEKSEGTENGATTISRLVNRMYEVVAQCPDFAQLLQSKEPYAKFVRKALRVGMEKIYHLERTAVQTQALTKRATRAEMCGDFLLLIDQDKKIVLYSSSTGEIRELAGTDATFIDANRIAYINESKCVSILNVRNGTTISTCVYLEGCTSIRSFDDTLVSVRKNAIDRVVLQKNYHSSPLGANHATFVEEKYVNHGKSTEKVDADPEVVIASKTILTVGLKNGQVINIANPHGEARDQYNGFPNKNSSLSCHLSLNDTDIVVAGFSDGTLYAKHPTAQPIDLGCVSTRAIPTCIATIKCTSMINAIFAVGYNDGQVRIWDMEKREVIKIIPSLDKTKGHPIALFFKKGKLRTVFSTGKVDDCYLNEYATFEAYFSKFAQM